MEPHSCKQLIMLKCKNLIVKGRFASIVCLFTHQKKEEWTHTHIYCNTVPWTDEYKNKTWTGWNMLFDFFLSVLHCSVPFVCVQVVLCICTCEKPYQCMHQKPLISFKLWLVNNYLLYLHFFARKFIEKNKKNNKNNLWLWSCMLGCM